MDDIIFLVELDADGTFVAWALQASIFTNADGLDALRDRVRDAVEPAHRLMMQRGALFRRIDGERK